MGETARLPHPCGLAAAAPAATAALLRPGNRRLGPAGGLPAACVARRRRQQQQQRPSWRAWVPGGQRRRRCACRRRLAVFDVRRPQAVRRAGLGVAGASRSSSLSETGLVPSSHSSSSGAGSAAVAAVGRPAGHHVTACESRGVRGCHSERA